MFTSIFKDYEGNASSMNLIWTLSVLIITGVWIIISYKTGILQPVTSGDALWFTSLFGGKVLQSFIEKKSPKPTESEPSGLIQDSDGKPSFSRLVWMLIVSSIIFIWAYLSIKHNAIQHFTPGHAAWFTALFGSKVGQTYIERQNYSSDGDSDSDEYEGPMTNEQMKMNANLINAQKEINIEDMDKIVTHLQETVKLQTDFNKNLIELVNKK